MGILRRFGSQRWTDLCLWDRHSYKTGTSLFLRWYHVRLFAGLLVELAKRSAILAADLLHFSISPYSTLQTWRALWPRRSLNEISSLLTTPDTPFGNCLILCHWFRAEPLVSPSARLHRIGTRSRSISAMSSSTMSYICLNALLVLLHGVRIG